MKVGKFSLGRSGFFEPTCVLGKEPDALSLCVHVAHPGVSSYVPPLSTVDLHNCPTPADPFVVMDDAHASEPNS